MSDVDVLLLIQEMEGILGEDPERLDSEAVEDWHQRFLAAMLSAEKGPAWPGIVERSHGVAARVEAAARTLSVRKDAIRHELEDQFKGQQALRAYKPTRT